jgi:putative ABC transport system ATP-binding protein
MAWDDGAPSSAARPTADDRRVPPSRASQPTAGDRALLRPIHPVIQIDGLVRTYTMGQSLVRALRGVSLRIERGEYVAIMGPSGSGKSTLMNTLGCLDAPTSGRYLLDGVDVRSLDEDDLSDLRNRKIGFVFQGFNLVPKISALANVEMPLVYSGLSRGDRRRRAVRALEAVGMGARIDHGSNELSGGQQQRVAIARAIVTNPALILADEPTGNLDSRSTEDVLRIFEDLNASGRTVVMITHEDDVAAHADRLVRLADGRIVGDESVVAESGSAVGRARLARSVA